MLKGKRLVSLLCASALMLAAAGCASNKQPVAVANGEWKWERRVEFICPWGAGGGADTTLRTFAAAFEKEIGQPVVINNKSGAGGVTGVDFAIQQPADGYTWFLNTQSTILAQLTGATDVKVYENSVPVSRLVHDTNIIVASKNAPYNNLTELLAYIEEHPSEIKAGCMAITGLDGLTIKLTFDGKVEPVAYTEGAQLNADLMGGHMQLGCVGPAEVMGLLESGDLKTIVVVSENRMTLPVLKDIECTGELGVKSFYGPARGMFCAPGTPEAAIKAFEEAAKKAVESEEFQSWAKTQGLDQRPGYLGSAEYKTWWDAEYEGLKSLL